MQFLRSEKNYNSCTANYENAQATKNMKKGKRILKILVVAIIGLLLLGMIIMLLWNWLIPSIFNVREITFWEALGLFVFAKILLGAWGGGRWKHGPAGHWGNRYYEKLASMTPEERERFKQRMTEKWCRPRQQDPEANV